MIFNENPDYSELYQSQKICPLNKNDYEKTIEENKIFLTVDLAQSIGSPLKKMKPKHLNKKIKEICANGENRKKLQSMKVFGEPIDISGKLVKRNKAMLFDLLCVGNYDDPRFNRSCSNSIIQSAQSLSHDKMIKYNKDTKHFESLVKGDPTITEEKERMDQIFEDARSSVLNREPVIIKSVGTPCKRFDEGVFQQYAVNLLGISIFHADMYTKGIRKKNKRPDYLKIDSMSTMNKKAESMCRDAKNFGKIEPVRQGSFRDLCSVILSKKKPIFTNAKCSNYTQSTSLLEYRYLTNKKEITEEGKDYFERNVISKETAQNLIEMYEEDLAEREKKEEESKEKQNEYAQQYIIPQSESVGQPVLITAPIPKTSCPDLRKYSAKERVGIKKFLRDQPEYKECFNNQSKYQSFYA